MVVGSQTCAAILCIVALTSRHEPATKRGVSSGKSTLGSLKVGWSIWIDGATIALGRVVQASLIWLPVWVAGIALSLEDVSLIGLSTRLVSAVAAVVAAVKFSIRPQLAALAATGDWLGIRAVASRIALYTSTLAVFAVLFFLLLGDAAVEIVFGDGYDRIGLIIALLLIGTIGESMAGPVDEILKMSGSAGIVLTVQLLLLPISAGLELIMAFLLGVEGLAIAYGVTFGFMYMSLWAHIIRKHRVVIAPRLHKRAMNSGASPREDVLE